MRVGQGYDVHALATGRSLVLGGVRIESDRGLAGHSDGDAAVHAVIDALLGAAALGDIGTHFPSSDERWRGANSLELLKQTVNLIAGAGYAIVNVDLTIVATAPRISPYVAEMRAALSLVLDIDLTCVSVKATTTDGLGAIGRGEGIEAQAIALIEERAAP
jgi:2-C-methyl-D-erythritol 2,4-cyclodiphosphate synthase